MTSGSQKLRLALLLAGLAPLIVGGLIAATPLGSECALPVLVAAGVGSVFTAAGIFLATRPLARLVRVCDAVAAGGPLELPDDRRTDELGRIAQALRELDARHRAAQEAYATTAAEVARGLGQLADGTPLTPPAAAGPFVDIVAPVATAFQDAAKKLTALRARLAQATRLIQELPTPLVSVDDAGVVRYVNTAAERVLGQPAAACLRKPFPALLAPPASATEPFGREVLTPEAAAGWLKQRAPSEAVVQVNRPQGSALLTALPFRPTGTTGTAAHLVLRDLSEDYVRLAADRSHTRQESLRAVWEATAKAGAEALEAILATNRLLLGDAKQSSARDVMVPRLTAVRQHAGSLEAYVRTVRWLTRALWGELPKPMLSEFQAAEPVRAAIEQLALRLKGRNISTVVNDRGGWLCADDEWIRTALLGVLAHAAESTHDATVGVNITRLTPTAQAGEERVVFEVVDAGPPLTDAQRRDLQAPFGGLLPPDYLAPHSAGFLPGLVLADELARQMGGGLEFGTTPGGSLVVRMTVPTRMPGGVVAEPAPEVIDAGPIEELVMGWRLGTA